MVAHQTLTLFVRVRILHPLPQKHCNFGTKITVLRFFVPEKGGYANAVVKGVRMDI